MSIRVLLRSRAAGSVIRLLSVVVIAALGGCAGQDQLAPQSGGSGDGGLFARAFDEISELYIEPVSTRRIALAGLARLSTLDRGFAVTDGVAGPIGGPLTVTYEGHNIADFAAPPERDTGRWGDLVARLIAEARATSPAIAAVPQDKIDKTVFDGITGALDRFSRYATAAVARDQRAERDGYGGIGVTLDPADEHFRVSAVSPHGPADRAGIRPEDQILAIDGVPTSGSPHHDVVERLRGPIGSSVALKVLQPGAGRLRQVRLSRAAVYEQTVTASRDGDIAVFRVHRFNHNTTRRVAERLAELRREGGGRLAGIVLDLRGNPGGLLDQAVSLADLFIHDGPIVYAIGRHPASRQHFAASGKSIAPRVPMAVLINGGSASAAEIVAAALQDAGRAIVIGSSSYGKGTVQTVLRMPNDGELILTWARLVAPSGYLLQQHGVVPTICTADLGDGANALGVGLQRAAQAPTARVNRGALDEKAWAALRGSCPGRHTRPAVDLAVAERVLSDPALYAEPMAGSRVTQTAAAERSASP